MDNNLYSWPYKTTTRLNLDCQVYPCLQNDLLCVKWDIPVSRRISRRPRKKFGLAAVDFAKPPAEKEIWLSRRFSAGLADDAHHKRVSLAFSPVENTNKITTKWL